MMVTKHESDVTLTVFDRPERARKRFELSPATHEIRPVSNVTGGILGGLAGWLVGVGALAIPGVGPIIAAGALGTALSGAAMGAGLGAIAGALVSMGIPEDEAKAYEDEVRAGRTLVVVRAGARVDEAWRLLRAYGARDVQHRGDGGEPLRRTPEDRADVTTPGTSPLDMPERTTADVTERTDR